MPSLDANLKTNEEHTALYYALLKYESGDTDSHSYVSKLLAKKQTHPDATYTKNCESLLQILIKRGAEKAAIFLCDHLSNLNHVNSDGETALHSACQRGEALLVEKLIKGGANTNLLTNELRQSPLHYAVQSDSLECVEAFIGIEGVNFNVRDINGDTPVGVALNQGHRRLVPVLIKGGADVNVRNGKDFTLLHQAILKEDYDTALFLLDNGADINAK